MNLLSRADFLAIALIAISANTPTYAESKPQFHDDVGYVDAATAWKSLNSRPDLQITKGDAFISFTDPKTFTSWFFPAPDGRVAPVVFRFSPIDTSAGRDVEMRVLCELPAEACQKFADIFSQQIFEPARKKYLLREQVVKGAILGDSAKAAVNAFYKKTGRLPHDNLEAEIASDPVAPSDQYVSAVVVSDDLIRVTFSGPLAGEEISGKVLAYKATLIGGDVHWSCNVPETTVANSFLPSICRRN